MCDDGKVPRDCVFVMVTVEGAAQCLGDASGFKVRVFDALMRAGVAQKLSENVLGVLAAVRDWAIAPSNQVLVQEPLPCCASSFDRGFAVLGLLVYYVSKAAGEAFHEAEVLDGERPLFVARVRNSLSSCFGALRSEADKRGSRDVLLQLSDRAACETFLESLSAPQVAYVAPAVVPGVAKSRQCVVEVSDFQPLKFLTWNISGATKSSMAPASFTSTDKLAAVQLEIGRWQPDIVSLQECVDGEALPQLRPAYNLVGSIAVEDSRRSCGFVHLYVRKGLAADRVGVPKRCPAVLAKVLVGRRAFDVAAVHLMPGQSGKSARQKQLRDVVKAMRPGSRFVVGDMNVRPEEEEDLRGVGSFSDARYEGRSFYPGQSWYDSTELSVCGRNVGYAFDRAFYVGGLWAEAFLVGKARIFSEGVSFSLSDHYAVLGYLDVHPCHSTDAKGVAARRDRRGALAALRDQACVLEAAEVRAMSQDAWQLATVQKARADVEVLEEAVRKQRLAIKDRRKNRDVAWERAFGAESLFGLAAPGERPARACELGWEPFDAALNLELPAPVGFASDPRSSLANISAQVLLRVGKVVAWLSMHKPEQCGEDAGNCAACALLAARRALQGVSASSKRDRSVAERCEILRCLRRDDGGVGDLRAVAEEVFARVSGWPKALPWPRVSCDGPASVATVFDALFSFVFEVRRCCDECKHVTLGYERASALEVPSPCQGCLSKQTLSDAYLDMCGPSVDGELRPCPGASCSGVVTLQRVQKKLLHFPEVLLVKVSRDGCQDGKTSRHAFQVEDYVSFQGCGNAELAAVAYNLGAEAGNRRHACAVLGQDRCFWFFEDGRTPRRVGADISAMYQRSVEWLVYVPTKVWAGFASTAEQVLRPSGAQVSGDVCEGQGSQHLVPAVAGRTASQLRISPAIVAKRVLATTGERGLSKDVRASKSARVVEMLLRGNLSAPDSSAVSSASSAGHCDDGQSTMYKTPLWIRMVETLQIPPDVSAGVLAHLQARFGLGLAWDFAMQSWFVDLSSLEAFARNIHARLQGVDLQRLDGCIHLVPELVGELLSQLEYAVSSHRTPLNLEVSDAEMLVYLRGRGFHRREGRVWGRNNCLPDSLLQLLEILGLVSCGRGQGERLTDPERQVACGEVREHLCAQPELVPRDPDGSENREAYMQHHRHADAIVKHFVSKYPGPCQLPAVGLCLHVHARYDTDRSPADTWRICGGVGAGQGRAMDLHLYCSTGREIQGVHYDPLVLVRPDLPDADVISIDAGPVSEVPAADGVSIGASSSGLTTASACKGGGAVLEDAAGAVASSADTLEPWQEELRKMFSPQVPDPHKCLARVFNKAHGGQCKRPSAGKVCGRCGPEPAHGFVTGPVPERKWKDFKITAELVSRLKEQFGQLQVGGRSERDTRDAPDDGEKAAEAPRQSNASAVAEPACKKPRYASGDARGDGEVPSSSGGLPPALPIVAAGDAAVTGESRLKRRKGDGLGRVLLADDVALARGVAEPLAEGAERAGDGPGRAARQALVPEALQPVSPLASAGHGGQTGPAGAASGAVQATLGGGTEDECAQGPRSDMPTRPPRGSIVAGVRPPSAVDAGSVPLSRLCADVNLGRSQGLPGSGAQVGSSTGALRTVAEEARLGVQSRRALLALAPAAVGEVLQRFLTDHAATGEDIHVTADDVTRVRSGLHNNEDLKNVLSQLMGACARGADPGEEYRRRMVDRFVGLLHLRHAEQQGPRRLCD